MNLIVFLLVLLFASDAYAAPKRVQLPEIAGNGIDDDLDGVVDEAVATSISLDPDAAGQYHFHFKDCGKITYANVADETFVDSFRVEKPAGSGFRDGEIHCYIPSLPAATYNLHLEYSSPAGVRGIWVKAGSAIGNGINSATQGTVLQAANTRQWAQLVYSGSAANFRDRMNGGSAVSFVHAGGPFLLAIKGEGDVRFGCGYLTTSDTPTRTCPGEAQPPDPPPLADVKIFELGAATPPVAFNSAAFDNANVFQFTGSVTGVPCAGVITAKALWQNTTTDRGFLSIVCADTDDETVQTTNDLDNLVTTAQDKVDFRWRFDSSAMFDTNTQIIVGNLHPVYTDGDFSGANGTRNLAVNLNTTIVRNIVSSTSWNIFLAFDLGHNITPGTTGLCQLGVADKDAGVSSAIALFHGTSITDIGQYGLCDWSADTVPVSGDVTAPVVTAPAVPAASIGLASLIVTGATNEAGTCRVHYGTTTGVYTAQSSGSPSSNGLCNESVVGLDGATEYFLQLRVTDAAGNTGSATEISATTLTPPSCTHWAAPSVAGAADGSSVDDPFLIASFWPVAGPGKHLCLKDGHYTGLNSMIKPPSTLNGNALNPIKVTAINDGAVLIDGGGVAARIPVQILSDWFVIEGINVTNKQGGTPTGTCHKTGGEDFRVVSTAPAADDNVFRRIVAYDGGWKTNESIFHMRGKRNLLEDVVCFGQGRKCVSASQGGVGNNTTARRVFAKWTLGTYTGPKMSFTAVYNNTGFTCENCVGMWDLEYASQPCETYGIFGADAMNQASVGQEANARLLGSIGIVRDIDNAPNWQGGMMFGVRSADDVEFDNNLLYNEGGHTALRAINAQVFDGGSSASGDPVGDSCTVGLPCNRQINNTTKIGFTAADTISTHATNGWTTSNLQSYATPAAAAAAGASPFQATAGTGARVCLRYKDRVLTTEKLWPFPMEDRLNAAWVASGRSLVDLFGAGLTLTDYIESKFGTIPAACKN